MSWSAEFFISNRRKLAKKLDGGLLVLSAHSLMQRQNDTAYKFAQEADFWYMTGISEPDWLVVYDGQRDYTWIVSPNLSESEKLFDGGGDFEQMMTQSGANELISVGDFEKLLRTLARKHSAAYTSRLPSGAVAERVTENPAARRLNTVLRRIFGTVLDCRSDIAALRAIKSQSEIAAISKAVAITVEAFSRVRQSIDDYQYEHEIDADLTHDFRSVGAEHAYDPIVAGSTRACTLHYIANNQPIRKNTAVLIDAGAKIDYYCADITRTYVKGTATKRYRQIHESLQKAHEQIIATIEPHMPVADYLKRVDEIMISALTEVGLLVSAEDARYRQYFPHAISHGLGLDVHDSLGKSRTLDPGMVLTVEPGIYIRKEGIGIRIEDDILITATGHKNLSAGLSTGY